MSPATASRIDTDTETGLPLVVSVHTGSADLVDGLADEWRALCEEGASDEPFYRPEWVSAYLHAFAPDATLQLSTVRRGRRLRAVLPLVHRRGVFFGLPARLLESPSNVHSCRFDLVRGAEDGDAAVGAVWKELRERGDWDVIVLRDVPEDGAGERLLDAAQADGWPTGHWETNQTPVVTMAGVVDPFSVLQRGHFRANLRRRLRHAQATWPVSLERIDSANTQALDDFYAVEASGWKGRQGTAIACSRQTRCFYDEVGRSAAAFGYLSLYLLRFGHDVVAGQFGLFYRRRYYTPKIGFEERYAEYSPGHLGVEEALRDCLGRGVLEFDFLGPSMPWKLEWTSRVRRHAHCYIFRDSIPGRALYRATLGVMTRMRPLVRRGRAFLVREDRG